MTSAFFALLVFVTTVETACDLIERSHFDGVLLDANLHGRLVDAIATALLRRNIPFAFVTGHNRDGLPEAFRTNAVVNKPCDHEQVVEAAVRLVATPTSARTY